MSNNTFSDKLLRLDEIIGPKGPLPISRSAFYEGIRKGRYPAPIHLGPRTSVWRQSAIESLLEDLEGVGGPL